MPSNCGADFRDSCQFAGTWGGEPYGAIWTELRT